VGGVVGHQRRTALEGRDADEDERHRSSGACGTLNLDPGQALTLFTQQIAEHLAGDARPTQVVLDDLDAATRDEIATALGEWAELTDWAMEHPATDPGAAD
jgi:hypothetical protein